MKSFTQTTFNSAGMDGLFKPGTTYPQDLIAPRVMPQNPMDVTSNL